MSSLGRTSKIQRAKVIVEMAKDGGDYCVTLQSMVEVLFIRLFRATDSRNRMGRISK